MMNDCIDATHNEETIIGNIPEKPKIIDSIGASHNSACVGYKSSV